MQVQQVQRAAQKPVKVEPGWGPEANVAFSLPSFLFLSNTAQFASIDEFWENQPLQELP